MYSYIITYIYINVYIYPVYVICIDVCSYTLSHHVYMSVIYTDMCVYCVSMSLHIYIVYVYTYIYVYIRYVYICTVYTCIYI